MKPKPTDDPDAEREQLHRAANRLSIKIHGCAIDSLSRRDREAVERLYRFAAEDRAQYWARQQHLRMSPPVRM